MQTSRIAQYAFLHALGAALYIALVALLMANAEKLFGKEGDGDVLNIITFLSVFVVSAAVMGITIFGRPALWYLNGSKKEAVVLALATVGFLAGFAVIFILFLIIR